MFNWKSSGILVTGLFLSVFWVWFSNSVQKEQDFSKLETIELKTEVLKNNLQKLYNFQALKNSKVKAPFLFSLKLDSKTLAPKNFKVRKKEHLNLSALKIKASFKESGMKQAFFLYSDYQKKSAPFITRVKLIKDSIYLDGLSLDYVTNSLGYVFPNQSWSLLGKSDKVLMASDESQVGQTVSTKSGNSIKKIFQFSGGALALVVDVPRPYSNALISFMGVAGIILMMISMFFISGSAFNFDLAKLKAKSMESKESMYASENSSKTVLTFEEEMNREIENLADDIEHMEMTPIGEVSPVKSKESSLEEMTKNSEASQFKKAPLIAKVEDLDYSDFLMENPVLGATDFIETPKTTEQYDVGRDSFKKPFSSQETKVDASTPVVNSDQNGSPDKDLTFEDSEVEENQAETWLKLAEDLTANLDEFAKKFEREKSSQNSQNQADKDTQV